MKQLLFSFIFLSFCVTGYGQLYPQNSLYLVDLYQINPAYGGLENSLSINFNYRDQWTGFEQNPQQLYMNANLPLYMLNGGIGATIQSDRIGALNISSVKLSYNYLQKSILGLVSSGLSLGYSRLNLDGSILVTPEGIYENGAFSHEDAVLLEGKFSGGSLDYDLGVFIGNDRFDIGLSFSNLFLPVNRINNMQVGRSNSLKFFYRMPLYMNETIFYPSLLVKTDLHLYQTDLSCLVKNGSVFGGLSIRGYSKKSIDALVILGGIKLNKHYTLSYSYDLGLNSLRTVSQGAHELNINYNLNKLIGIGLPPEIIYNPRNL